MLDDDFDHFSIQRLLTNGAYQRDPFGKFRILETKISGQFLLSSEGLATSDV